VGADPHHCVILIASPTSPSHGGEPLSQKGKGVFLIAPWQWGAPLPGMGSFPWPQAGMGFACAGRVLPRWTTGVM